MIYDLSLLYDLDVVCVVKNDQIVLFDDSMNVSLEFFFYFLNILVLNNLH